MWEKEIEVALYAIKKAREKVLEIYHSSDFGVEIKEDNSPVTKADKMSDEIIRNILKENFPNYAILTEESIDDKSRLNNDFVWIVDPIDGTKEFVAHNDQFTINIALSYKHDIVVGVIDIPVYDETFYMGKGKGSFYIHNGVEKKINVNDNKDNLIALTSRFHVNEDEIQLINKHQDRITKIETIGSSIKGCYIAMGKAEISYRKSPNTKEWDTAAMQGILEEAGGYLLTFDKKPLRYNREDVYNREGYILINNIDNFLI